jgi:hypothetical protein
MAKTGSLMQLEARNLKQVQNRMLRAARELEPGNAATEAIQFVTLGMHRYMTIIVHVRTGRLKNSLFPEIKGTRGRIFTNVNYAPFEESRGGPHAFMERTAKQAYPPLAKNAMDRLGVKVQTAWGNE